MIEERGGADDRSYPSCTHEVGLHVLGRVRCGQQMGGGQNSASPPIRVLLYHVLRCLGGLRSHLVHVEGRRCRVCSRRHLYNFLPTDIVQDMSDKSRGFEGPDVSWSTRRLSRSSPESRR